MFINDLRKEADCLYALMQVVGAMHRNINLSKDYEPEEDPLWQARIRISHLYNKVRTAMDEYDEIHNG